jgi:hypothetical protein
MENISVLLIVGLANISGLMVFFPLNWQIILGLGQDGPIPETGPPP